MFSALPKSFYERDTLSVAKDLLGKVLVNNDRSGYIVETEAYIGVEDKACHAATHRKETCFPIWGPAGFTYIYLIYGMHHMLNISTESDGFPAAVLIRALEPIGGISLDTKGPGKLTRALGIDKSTNNSDITTVNGPFITDKKSLQNFEIVKSKRIGVDYAKEFKDKPWRFYIKGNPFVSVR